MRAAARHFTRVAYQIITAFDDQPSAVDEAVGNFMTRVPVHGLRGGPCDVHPFGARLLIQAFQIDEPDGFIYSSTVMTMVPSSIPARGPKSVF